MSAFDRHPLRAAYRAAAIGRSPQNRRVRFAVDTDMARAKTFPNRMTRQQSRRVKLTGQQIVTHNPDEIAD